MASGAPLTGEQKARIVRLAKENYKVPEIVELTGFAKSTIQRVLKEANVYPQGYVFRPRKKKQERRSFLAVCKDEFNKFLALFGDGKPKPKKRRHRKPKKEVSL